MEPEVVEIDPAEARGKSIHSSFHAMLTTFPAHRLEQQAAIQINRLRTLLHTSRAEAATLRAQLIRALEDCAIKDELIRELEDNGSCYAT